VAIEAGYLGQFLDDRLKLGLDLYYNIYQNEIEIDSNVVGHPQYLIDLGESSYMFENHDRAMKIIGSELAVRFKLTPAISLLASWTHREILGGRMERAIYRSPKNLITLGGRFITDWGLLGSLYLHSRSEFWDLGVDNPAGIMEPYLEQHMDNNFLVLARLGFRWAAGKRVQMETGLKLFLPVSHFSEPHFRFRERGGGVTPFGVKYGGDELTRVIALYCKGSF
jgi:hypothetical protein